MELRGIVDRDLLVVGALSDPTQNNRIKNLCEAQDILFNNADGEAGDVIIPSVTRGENFQIAISTGGSKPGGIPVYTGTPQIRVPCP